MRRPPTWSEGCRNLRSWTGCLVAGDGFGCLFVSVRCGTATVGMTIAVTIRRGNGARPASVGEVGRNRLRDVLHCADLHDRLLRLLQHQLFVNRANLGLLFV